MELKFIHCLILTLLPVGGKLLVQAKAFHCLTNETNNNKCTIVDVTTEDSSVVIPSVIHSNSDSLRPIQLTIINSTIKEIPPIHGVSLNYLSCVGCGLANLSTQSFTTLSNLITLNISAGSFTKLNAKVFGQLSELKVLDVSHGALVEIDDAAFFNLTMLKRLYLSYNRISKISVRMFSPLKNLRILHLQFNNIEILDEGLFVNNGDLKVLDVSNNNLRRINGILFPPLRGPYIVQVFNNDLTMLDTINFNNTTYLYAYGNRIKRLHLRGNVQFLDATYNKIENVICDEISKNKLTSLRLSRNLLSEVGCISSLTKLIHLDLSYNNLGNLNESTFAAATQLNQLSLKSTNIGRLPTGIFAHQTQLQALDISSNRMGNIDLFGLLASSKNLQLLLIDGNNITELPYRDMKPAFSGLLTISIGDNSFNCTYLGQLIEYLNSDRIAVVSNSRKHTIYSENFNGIGCQEPPSITTPNGIKETVGVSKVDGNERLDAVIQKVLPQLSQLIVESDEHLKKLSEDISAIKRQIIDLNSDMHTSKAKILKINHISNIELEKQHLINRAQYKEIDLLKVELEKIDRELSSKLTAL